LQVRHQKLQLCCQVASEQKLVRINTKKGNLKIAFLCIKSCTRLLAKT
jgi:hypothetical protein